MSMVLPGEEEEGYMAATRHERSKILHNFTFPELKWGTQRHLRSVKPVCDDGGSAAGYQRSRRRSSPIQDATQLRFDGERSISRNRRSETKPSEKEGIQEYGDQIMSHIRTVTVKMMRESMFSNQASDEEEEEEEEPRSKDKEKQREGKRRVREVSPPEAPGEAVEARPWNLRKRREACKAPISGCENKEKRAVLMDPSIRSTKFISTLSKKEIEEDYMEMMGHRPPRRPKKRSRTIQKQVDLLKPAFYFTEITEDIY